MKPFSTLSLCVLFFVGGIRAQSDVIQDDTYKNLVGIDVSSFITNLVSMHPSDYYYYLEPGDYILGYKRYFGNNVFRIGVGGDYTMRYEKYGPNSSTNYTTHGYGFDGRIGYSYRQILSKRWWLYYGFDVAAGFGSDVSEDIIPDDNDNSANTYSDSYTYGAGPDVAISFIINKRLSLSTEGYIYYLYSEDKTRYDYYNDPAASNTRISRNASVAYYYPLFINFEVRL